MSDYVPHDFESDGGSEWCKICRRSCIGHGSKEEDEAILQARMARLGDVDVQAARSLILSAYRGKGRGKLDEISLLSELATVLFAKRTVEAEVQEARGIIQGHEEAMTDHRRLVRELDVAMNGVGAAQQASLCDIFDQLLTIIRERNTTLAHSPGIKPGARIRVLPSAAEYLRPTPVEGVVIREIGPNPELIAVRFNSPIETRIPGTKDWYFWSHLEIVVRRADLEVIP